MARATQEPMTNAIDRALAALETERGESRVKAHLVSLSSSGEGRSVDVEDLVEALKALRRRSQP
jgi:hypothetical protein